MNKFQYISQNFLAIKKQIKMGLIPSSVLSHYIVYSRYDYYRKQGYKIYESFFYVEEELNVPEIRVKRVKREMEEEYEDIDNKL